MFIHSFLFRDMSSSRLRNKIYKYGVFFFFADGKVRTTKTTQICDGYRGKVKEGETVELLWEGTKVWGRIVKLHGKCCSCMIALLWSQHQSKKEIIQ